MTKKTRLTWVDYKWWLILAACSVFLAIKVFEQVYSVFFITDAFLVKVGLILLSLLIYGISGLLIYLFARLCGGEHSRLFTVLTECFLWILIIAFFVLRFIDLLNFVETNQDLLNTAIANLHSEVLVSEKALFEGAWGLYADVLRWLFAFSGTHEIMVFYLQFILQIISVVMIFFSLCFLSGKITAYTAVFILAVSQSFRETVMLYQPEVLYFILWTAVLLLLTVYYRISAGTVMPDLRLKRIFIVFIGFFTGVIFYIDLSGILLVAAGFYLFYLVRKNWRAYIFDNIFFLLANILSFLFMLIREATIKNSIVTDDFRAWFNSLSFDLTFNILIPEENLAVLMVISMFCLALAAIYFKSGSKSLNIYAFFILLLSVVFPIFKLSTVDLNMWLIFAWAAAAGLGLQALMRLGFMVSKADKMDIEAESGEEGEESKAVVSESRYDTSTGTKYLENPLPLPPKPVRRVMTYPYSIPEDKMCYDVEVSDEDDYDLK